jgi:hypothetical protein
MPAPAESSAPCAGVVSAAKAADVKLDARVAEAEAERETETGRESDAIARL